MDSENVKFEYVLQRLVNIDAKIKTIVEKMDKLELQVKDIDMDVNDLFDDVEGKYEDNNK